MILLQTIVSRAGFRDPSENGRRTYLLRQVLEKTRPAEVDVVLLPGGYWTVDAEPMMASHAQQVASLASGNEVVLVAGIDVNQDQSKFSPAAKGEDRATMPYFALAAGRRRGQEIPLQTWRQTSSDSSNAWDVPEGEVPGKERIVAVAECRIAVLICGELFSPHARTAMVSERPNLIVDLGHESMGTGVTPNMESMANAAGCVVAHTHHVAESGNACLHFVDALGTRDSVPIAECDWVGDDTHWIAWQLRSI